jgi:hypothetical protein
MPVFAFPTCVSIDFPAFLLSIDSSHSDLPLPITIICRDRAVGCVGYVQIFRIPPQDDV